MPIVLKTATLLLLSNVFMTFAWYAHLKDLNNRAWYIAALVSWGIASAEYMLQVPANRIGYTALTLPQLKILQGGHSAFCVCSLCGPIHGSADKDGLSLGRSVSDGRCLFYIQGIGKILIAVRCFSLDNLNDLKSCLASKSAFNMKPFKPPPFSLRFSLAERVWLTRVIAW